MAIKSVIEYFYKISVLELHCNENVYFFNYKTDEYIFIPSQRTELELLEIYQLTENNQLYDQIVLNIEKKYLTYTKKEYYVLLKKSKLNDGNFEQIITQSKQMPVYPIKYKNIDRTNWVEMWSKKIDYIEYQLLHIESKYPIISKSINYYIGMTETAISYLNNNFSLVNNDNVKCVISHKRVVKNNFNNPMNIVVDYFARDVAEYLKYIFIRDEYNYSDIDNFFKRCNLSEGDAKLIYARLMYPSYYFDLYDRVINGNDDEKKILLLISRCLEYEEYVKNIYNMLINGYSNIFAAEWI